MKNVVEDFTCEECGQANKGSGTTDHCFACLWGKHVDFQDPGDRQSPCGGKMKPLRAEYLKSRTRIRYKCQKCSHKFVVDSGKLDNKDLLIELMR